MANHNKSKNIKIQLKQMTTQIGRIFLTIIIEFSSLAAQEQTKIMCY